MKLRLALKKKQIELHHSDLRGGSHSHSAEKIHLRLSPAGKVPSVNDQKSIRKAKKKAEAALPEAEHRGAEASSGAGSFPSRSARRLDHFAYEAGALG